MSNGTAKTGEEDFDDLDDVLDQFTKPEIPPQTKSTIPPPSSSSANLPSRTANPSGEDVLSDNFAKQLADEMEAMLRAMSGESGPSGSEPQSEPDTQAQDAAFREAWNKMIIQELEGDGKGNGLGTMLERRDDTEEDAHTTEQKKPSGDEKQKMPEAEDPFQKAIRQAMEKLQDSDDTLKADSKMGKDSLEGLLSSLGDLNLSEESGENGENIGSLLESVMTQLMSKDILYEPLKELDTKYPEYLAQNASTLPQDELSRFTDQKLRVSQIIRIFEDPSYSDDNAAQSTEILRLMNEMQSYGSPPSEIMGPMPPGFDLGPDGMPKVPDGCAIV